jgi:putative endonuclease
MQHAYALQSERFCRKFYVGLTSDLEARLRKHNQGGVPYTSPFRPWKSFFPFASEMTGAREFERYLKPWGAFATRHFM